MAIGFYFDEFEEAAYYRYSQKAIDFMEKIIHCKDCKFLNEKLASDMGDGGCMHFNTHSVKYDDFCSYGKRREQ